VSVKSTKQPSKRKKGESAREIYDQEIDSKKQKIIKKGTEGKKGRA
jgi:N-acetyltransferase 10